MRNNAELIDARIEYGRKYSLNKLKSCSDLV